MIIVRSLFISLFLLSQYSIASSTNGTEVIYKQQTASDIQSNIQMENRFRELNAPLLGIYNEGLAYFSSKDIDNPKIKMQVEDIKGRRLNEFEENIELEQLLYDSANNLINTISKEFGDKKLLEYYSEEFLKNIKLKPILIDNEKLENLLKYADENIGEGEQLSIRKAYKEKLPYIENQDFSAKDLSTLSFDGVPIWASKFEKSAIKHNSLCTCSDIDLSAADISASIIQRCKECDQKNEILKLADPENQKISCKGAKAERTKFALGGIDTSQSDFSYSDLKNSSWTGDINVVASNFHSANFSGAFIENFSCNECNFTSVNLTSIKILGFLNLIKADIEDRVMIDLSEQYNIYFDTSDYSKIPNYSKVGDKKYPIILKGVNYKYNLSGIDLSNKYLRIISDENVFFNGANFSNTILEDSVIENSSMQNVNFNSARFVSSNITAKLSGSSFTNAKKDPESKIVNLSTK
jgi:uncharacterized protein YjbI with pentapeptide repeats